MAENKYMVGVQGNTIVVGLVMRTARMSKPEALNLAAWLVALAADDPEKDLQPIVEDILKS